MMAFGDLFHEELHNLSPNNDAKLQEVQRSYGSSPAALTAALDMQDAIMKHMKRITTVPCPAHLPQNHCVGTHTATRTHQHPAATPLRHGHGHDKCSSLSVTANSLISSRPAVPRFGTSVLRFGRPPLR